MSIFADLSDFIGNSVAEREIEHKGKTHKFYFRELPADKTEDLFLDVDSDPKKNKRLRSKILAAIICDAEGGEGLTVEEAGKLPNELANKLQKCALEVNGLGVVAEAEAKKE